MSNSMTDDFRYRKTAQIIKHTLSDIKRVSVLVDDDWSYDSPDFSTYVPEDWVTPTDESGRYLHAYDYEALDVTWCNFKSLTHSSPNPNGENIATRTLYMSDICGTICYHQLIFVYENSDLKVVEDNFYVPKIMPNSSGVTAKEFIRRFGK